MLDHFGNMTEINPPSVQEYELRLRQKTRDAARQALKEIMKTRKSAEQARTERSLLARIMRFFGVSKQP